MTTLREEQIRKANIFYKAMLSSNSIAELSRSLDFDIDISALRDLPYRDAALMLFVLCCGIIQGPLTDFKKISRQLSSIDHFYRDLGGLIGYYEEVLALIDKAKRGEKDEVGELYPPPYTDMTNHSALYWEALKTGLEHLSESAEIYVVGGAGDRLNLRDEKTNVALPAARLTFLGRTLLENLIRDLEAKEYLAYKLLGKRIRIPVLFMTSVEKNNDGEIVRILEEHGYFGRPKETFFRIVQPLAPVIAEDGRFVCTDEGGLFLKPGGHGVIWKLAHDAKALDWFKGHNCRYLSIRQVNNPLAFVDCASLILLGLGAEGNKSFGFASCNRLPNLSEGINVLEVTGDSCAISNYEYTKSDSGYDLSNCPANTNILFASVSGIEKALEKDPFPGQMVNMGSHHVEENGVSLVAVRLESTMQNITDSMLEKWEKDRPEKLSTFLALFPRNRLFSVTKRLHGLFETPERAFFDMQNWARRSVERSGAVLPKEQLFEEFIQAGPNATILLHPAIGPIEEIVAQKIKELKMSEGSELELDLAECLLDNVDVHGSLRILSSSLNNSPACILRNVQVSNRGVASSGQFEKHWQRTVERLETCQITLQGNAAFVAENVELLGNISIDVPDGYVLRAISSDQGVQWRKDPIPEGGILEWKYTFQEGISLQLE